MSASEMSDWLVQSFNDRRLSRHERQSLREMVGRLDTSKRKQLREQAFQITREAFMSGGDDEAILNWLEEVISTVADQEEQHQDAVAAEAYFSPGDDCPKAIERLLNRAGTSVDLCVFTITDDRLAEAVLHVHRRTIPLRIITDNAKAEDLGSDIERFERAGIEVRIDQSPFHMHHKFAIFDGKTLLTGSYNWTRGAARDNEENLIVTADPRFVGPFQETFDHLWKRLEVAR